MVDDMIAIWEALFYAATVLPLMLIGTTIDAIQLEHFDI